MTKIEVSQAIEDYGNAYFDDPVVIDTQHFKHDLVFNWNEDFTKMDKIDIINISDNLMIDKNKRYRVVIEEIVDINLDEF